MTATRLDRAAWLSHYPAIIIIRIIYSYGLLFWPITSFVPFPMAAFARSRQKISAWPPRPAGSRSISGQATARPSPQAVSAHSGHDRSAKNVGGHTARLLQSRKQSGLEPLSRLHAAPWQPHQLISGRAPAARTKILHTRGSLAPRWMGLISRTADKANPVSSVTHPSRLWPGSVGQTHATDQAVTMAPVGTLPVSTYRQRPITSLRASAMIMIRRTRPFRSPTRR